MFVCLRFTYFVNLDDATSQYGCMRAVTACFVKNREFVRRFLHIEYVSEKDAASVTDTLLKVADMYNIEDFELSADGASTNRSVARNFKKFNHTCWSHTVHNIVQYAFKAMETNYQGFKQFYSIFVKFVEKISRRHLNSIFSKESGYVKIPSLSKTRWLSRRNCINAIIKNWEILKQNKSKLGLTDAEYQIFDNLQLFKDLQKLVNDATCSLLIFEIQKKTTMHLVLKTMDKWIRTNLKFNLNTSNTKFGRCLALEINKAIDIYVFGRGQAGVRIFTQ